MTTLTYILTTLAIAGTGLIAGTFFVFSIAIMRAFDELGDENAAAAMRSVNRVIQSPIFRGVFMSTALVSIVVAVMSALNWHSPASYYILAGSVLYVIGSFLVTVVFNVPLNNALESGAVSWPNYYRRWTLWNHLRAAASLASTCAFALSFAAAR